MHPFWVLTSYTCKVFKWANWANKVLNTYFTGTSLVVVLAKQRECLAEHVGLCKHYPPGIAHHLPVGVENYGTSPWCQECYNVIWFLTEDIHKCCGVNGNQARNV